MKFSKETLAVLKNYSTINNGVVLNPGNHIMTRSGNGATHAETIIAEEIETEMAIIDLNGFLSVLNIAGENAEVTVKGSSIVIKNARSEINWALAETDMVVVPPNKIDFPEPHVSFDISAEDYNQLMRASRGMGCDVLTIEPRNGKIIVSAFNKPADTLLEKPLYVYEAGDYDKGVDFKYIIHITNLKLIPGDYKVGLWNTGDEFYASKWETEGTFYIIAVEADSTSKFD